MAVELTSTRLKKKNYVWLPWVFAAARAALQLQWAGFALQWLPLLQSTGSRAHSLSGCSSQALEHRLGSCVVHGPSYSRPTLWHVGSSQIRGGTHVSCTGRQILYH